MSQRSNPFGGERFGKSPLWGHRNRDRDYIEGQRKLSLEKLKKAEELLERKGITLMTRFPMSFSSPAPAPKRELELSFQTEPIIAYRTWSVIQFETRSGAMEPRLGPVAAGRSHYPLFKPMEAFCNHTHHEAPYSTCQCGVWAVKDGHIDQVRGQYGGGAWGEVYLWGRVLEGSRGYRAQYAYPKHLQCGDEELGKQLRALYGVPVDVDLRAATSFARDSFMTSITNPYLTIGSGGGISDQLG